MKQRILRTPRTQLERLLCDERVQLDNQINSLTGTLEESRREARRATQQLAELLHATQRHESRARTLAEVVVKILGTEYGVKP